MDAPDRPAFRLLITRETMWRRFQDESAWAFHHHSTPQAKKLRTGDICLVYLTRLNKSTPGRIVAVVRVKAPGTMAPPKGERHDFYPFRLPFEIVAEFHPYVSFPEVVPVLRFIKQKRQYGVHLQGQSVARPPPEDVRTILARAASISDSPQSRNRIEHLLAVIQA